MSSKNNNSNEDLMTSIGTSIGKGVLIIMAAAIVLAATLAIALAKEGKLLKEEGYRFGDIVRAKLRFLLGIIPLTFVVVALLGYMKVDSLTDFGQEDDPKTEADFRLIAENRVDKYESAVRDMESRRNELRYAKEERGTIKRDFHEARQIEEKSRIEEKYLNNEETIQNQESEIKKLAPELKERKEKLATARLMLKKFRAGTYRKPIHFESKEIPFKIKALIYLDYLWRALVFLMASFGLSFLIAGATQSNSNKPFEKFALACLYPWMKVSEWGNWLMDSAVSLFKQSLVSVPKKEKNIFASQIMKLGPNPKAYLTVGGSGAGKTNLLKVMIEDRVRKGHGVIFFDFKADIELMDWMTGLSESSGRREDLMMISMSDPKVSHSYNPLQYGSETEITSQIMNSLTWSETFYRDVAESGLMIIIKAFCFRRDMGGKGFFLNDLYSFLTDASVRMDVLAEILSLSYPERFKSDLRRICEELSNSKKDNYQGLTNQLAKIMNSSAGEIVSGTSDDESEFNFKDAIREKKIAYLFMNSLKLKETASVMGKLMLQDLMKTVGSIYDDRSFIKQPITLIIDEFASFATPDFGEFIEKARGAGIGVIVAYQSRQSLNSIEGDLALKLNENTATKVVFQVQDSEDAEWFCGLLGTQKVEKETHQAEEGFLFGDTKTGMKSVREVEEYVVHPNELKSLKMGQALLVCTKVDPHFCVMKIDLAEEYSSEYVKVSKNRGVLQGQGQVTSYPMPKNESEALLPQDLA
jgi:hypothetical protein